jgi:hypothetical protein
LRYTLVPSYCTDTEIASPAFNPAKYFHVGQTELNELIRAGTVEVLDAKKRVWRMLTRALSPRSRKTEGGRISREIPYDLQMAMKSAMCRRPMEDLGAPIS